MPINGLIELDTKYQYSTNTQILKLTDVKIMGVIENILAAQHGTSGLELFKIRVNNIDNKGKKIPQDAYYRLLNKNIVADIRCRTGVLEKNVKLNYSQVKIPNTKDEFLICYINSALLMDNESVDNILDDIEEFTETYSSDNSDKFLRNILASILKLLLKVAVFDKSRSVMNVGRQYLNSDLLLCPVFNTKKETKYVTAFFPSIFFSEQNEIIVDVHQRSLMISNDVELSSTDANFVLTDESKNNYSVSRSCDARRTIRDFYGTGERFSSSRLFAHEYAISNIARKLQEANIDFVRQTFAPKYEVNSFMAQDSTFTVLKNATYIVDTKNKASELIEGYCEMVELLKNKFSAIEIIGPEKCNEMISSGVNLNFIFINGLESVGGTSIEYCSLMNDADIIVFNNTVQALERRKKDNDSNVSASFDAYTEVKITMLMDSLKGKYKPFCFQGFNISPDFAKNIVKYNKGICDLPTASDIHPEPNKLSDKEKCEKNIREGMNNIDLKVGKILSELRLKECLYTNNPLTFKSEDEGELFKVSDGKYTASFIRHTRNVKEYFHSMVTFKVKSNMFTVIDRKIEKHLHAVIVGDNKHLSVVDKLYNESFYLLDHSNGEVATSYSSIRTPKSLGNSSIDLIVEWLKLKEVEEKKRVFGKKSNHDVCIIPFYITKSRSSRTDKHIHLKNKQYHHLFVEPHKEGINVFLSNATSVGTSQSKQIRIKNIISWNSDGIVIPWNQSKVVSEYLNSHTFDIVSAKEVSKTSIFNKLAQMLLLN